MSKLTYKILMDPVNFNTFVQELTVPVPLGEHQLGKRVMTDDEVEAKWSKEEFISVLSEWGYERAAVDYVKDHKLYNQK